jgi:protocatechuate 3,4-dioxygenase beta subunit
MKFLVSSLALLLFAPVFFAQAPAHDPKSDLAKKEECSIAGMVVELAGSEPLKGAKIQLRRIDDRILAISIVTDVAGRFTLKGLAPGRYNLYVSKNGFVDQQYGQRKPGDPGSVLTLHAGQDLRDLLFRLIPSAVISGRVLDEEGEPLPWAVVSALREVYSEGKRKLSTEANFQTNDLGEFRIFGLPPGKYFISVSFRSGKDDGGLFMRRQELEETPNAPELGYAHIYYPGTPDRTGASSLIVKAGEEIPALEILMRKFRVYRVRGRVQNLIAAGPRRGRSINLSLAPKGGSLELDDGEQQVIADAKDGSFEIRDVLPGAYILTAYSFDESKWHAARSAVDVVNSDVEGVSVIIAPGVTISGRILWDGPAAPLENDLNIAAMPVDQTALPSSSSRVDAASSFTLQNLDDGAYRPQVWNLPKGCFVKSVRYAGVNASEDGFTVTRGNAASLEIILSSRGADVQGTVTDVDNLPAAGVWVVLVPDANHRSRFDLYQTQTTDQYGHFDFRGLPPGDYKLFSWEEVEGYAWQDPEFLKPIEDQGEKIELNESDQKTVNLSAIRTASARQKP